MTPDPWPPPRWPRGSKGPCGPRNPRGPKGHPGPPKNSSIRSRNSSGIEQLSEILFVVTVVMFTTAGVTAFATSANPLDGNAGIVTAAGAAVGVAELDAGEAVSAWPPQIKTMPRATIASVVRSDRARRCLIGSSFMMLMPNDDLSWYGDP